MSCKNKVFRDPVHGYISVPDDFCREFIDTPIFQRLRHIEQTSMRSLFPCARHDRFAHSLGCFHLATLAFDYFKKNTHDHFRNKIKDQDWGCLQTTFQLASLLHDCAHAPFSHTLEHYYVNSNLDKLLSKEMRADTDFASDYESCSAKPHEKASAYILLKHFGAKIKNFKGNPLLSGRMVLGCLFKNPGKDQKKRLTNCLIGLLNGTIDVDKLDYILRDTWASGINNVSIDIHRLLSALSISPKEDYLVFHKNALSVIQSVIDGRNFLYRWVYSHHKVVYTEYLLKKSVEKLGELLSKKKPNYLFTRAFSMDTFSKYVSFNKGLTFHLSTDQDWLFLLRQNQLKISEAREWFSRQHTKKPLWKTEAEYRHYFKDLSPKQKGTLRAQGAAFVNKFLKSNDTAILVPASSKEAIIEENEVRILLGDEYISYTTFLAPQKNSHSSDFFYIFISEKHSTRKKELLNHLKTSV